MKPAMLLIPRLEKDSCFFPYFPRNIIYDAQTVRQVASPDDPAVSGGSLR